MISSLFLISVTVHDRKHTLHSIHCIVLVLGEIAAEVGISRQAVHETLTRASARLRDLEAALGTAARFQRVESGLQSALSAIRENKYDEAQARLEELLDLE